MISPLLSARLHCLRWVAAALVVASHLKPLLFVDHADLRERGLLIDCFYLLTGLGHEAVIVFFVMSGLLVGGLSLERHRAQRFVPEEFLIQRFSRIYIVLAPALLAGFFWDQIGLMHFNAAGLYTESPKFRMDGVAAHQLSWRLLLENGLMLQHIAVPVFGSNGALWSISYEWWCYLLFFFCFIFIAGCRRHDPRFHYGAIACLLLLLLPPAVLRYFCIWLIGLAVLGAPLRRLRCHPLPAYGLLLAVLLCSRLSHDNLQPVFGLQRELVCDLAIAGACFLLFSALNQCNRRRGPAMACTRRWRIFHTPPTWCICRSCC